MIVGNVIECSQSKMNANISIDKSLDKISFLPFENFVSSYLLNMNLFVAVNFLFPKSKKTFDSISFTFFTTCLFKFLFCG